jgi:hypothetical protein
MGFAVTLSPESKIYGICWCSLWPVGPSFANRIVVPADLARNDASRPSGAPVSDGPQRPECFHVIAGIWWLAQVRIAHMGGDRLERKIRVVALPQQHPERALTLPAISCRRRKPPP